MSSATIVVQALSISTALVASGGIATLSLFDIPELKSQPASRSLPIIRWLFSRGSHLFPQAATISSLGFAYLAFAALRPGQSATQLLRVTTNSSKINGYIAAAALCIGIGPFTSFVMIPTNFKLIRLNEKYGGARSEQSAKARNEQSQPSDRSALDSVNGKDEAAEFTDISGPQSQTNQNVSAKDEKEVQELLSRFSALNLTRAGLIGAGGLMGLLVTLGGI
ncbi:hypothetical protein BT63DRAFT_474461 [Microthyrium microscopicum]|uniref:DUF1772-domain-containing protein n=1 Tax=Microthyrium microscopicum TaxID=703497 RepID=A0A6A6UTH7_9PEZI|nr:hypothetical protein BT63DRAFT_474461 [Microthyrium microscopicum]